MIRSALVDLFSSKDLRHTLKTLFSPCEVQDGLALSNASLTSKTKSENDFSSTTDFEKRDEIASESTFDDLQIKSIGTESNRNIELNAIESSKDVSTATVTSNPNLATAVGTTTPTLSMAFSPFLDFSEDRTSSNSKTLPESKPPCNHDRQPLDLNVEMTTDLMSNKSLTLSTNNGDVLVLSHSSKRKGSVYLPVIMEAQEERIQGEGTRRSTGKKRKSSHTSRLDRQPQKRFSLEASKSGDDSSDELFGSRKDGRIRLTTNIPRQVEAVNPMTRERMQLFASCSEASRTMDINRTRMSRSKLIL